VVWISHAVLPDKVRDSPGQLGLSGVPHVMPVVRGRVGTSNDEPLGLQLFGNGDANKKVLSQLLSLIVFVTPEITCPYYGDYSTDYYDPDQMILPCIHGRVRLYRIFSRMVVAKLWAVCPQSNRAVSNSLMTASASSATVPSGFPSIE